MLLLQVSKVSLKGTLQKNRGYIRLGLSYRVFAVNTLKV